MQRFRPDVVLAHSLGSAIAVEGLAIKSKQPRVLITAGAPLAWPRFVESWTPEASAWLAATPCEWVNLVDLTDPATGGRPLPADPYRTVTNIVVDNDHYRERWNWHPINSHSIRHYLSHDVLPDIVRGLI
jgi:hypothetical protein